MVSSIERKKACEECGFEEGVEAVQAMTAYHWDGEGEDPNRPLDLCKECKDRYVSYWTEMWQQVYSSY